ncbi:hypothetical protein Droror1_Dr00021862 [Drosera rotundifolia]
MAGRLGKRVIHFANLPIKLLMPNTFTNINEIALKTIPSATKIEIKRVLESLYGFEVERVQTLNMEGKKKKRGGLLFAKPDYKKAYVTLRRPLELSPELFPIGVIEEERRVGDKKSKTSVVEEAGEGKRRKSHWLETKERERDAAEKGRGWRGKGRAGGGGGRFGGEETVRFPWSSMRGAPAPAR